MAWVGMFFFTGDFEKSRVKILGTIFSFFTGDFFLTTFENRAFRELIKEYNVRNLLRPDETIFVTFEKVNLLEFTQ